MLRRLVIIFLMSCLLQPVIPAFAQVDTPPAKSGVSPSLTISGRFAASDTANYDSRDPRRIFNSTWLDPLTWETYEVQRGETLECLALRSGLAWNTLAQVNAILNPGLALNGKSIQLPVQGVTEPVIALHKYDTPLLVALERNLPLWDIIRRNPSPFYAGAGLVLPGVADYGCLPYPLTGIKMSLETFSRGRTGVLALETAEPATCEVSYLGQTEPCYSDDGLHLFAFLGTSALMDAGEYAITVTLRAEELVTVFDLPLVVERGRYGYQYIKPPASLNKLMDPEVMDGEIAYLEPWREIRTPVRGWKFPLQFPLSRSVSVSADYGDRRSYGGLVNGYHSGVDYRAWTGLPVLAPANGVVLMTQKLEARGNAILIDHGWGLVTGYWHLSRIDVEVGQHVKRGEQIGQVGNTGLSTGSHLHWEMWVNGVSVDGKQWLEADGLGDIAFPVLPVAPEVPSVVLPAPK